MGTIQPGTAPLPSLGGTPRAEWESLSPQSVDRMRVAGIPDGAIDIANQAVGGYGVVTNGGFQPPTVPSVPEAPLEPSNTNTAPLPTPSTTGSEVPPQGGGSLDQPDPNFPGLLQAHVLVFQATGTPEVIIKQISDRSLNAGVIDQYIQAEIMQNPEGWDRVTGNPEGTARAGLTQLMPSIQLPAPGQGSPGSVPSTWPQSPTTPNGQVPGQPGGWTPSVPGITPPTNQPVSGGGERVVMGVAGLGGVGIAGFLIHRWMKNRNNAGGATGAMEKLGTQAILSKFAAGTGATHDVAAAMSADEIAAIIKTVSAKTGMPEADAAKMTLSMIAGDGAAAPSRMPFVASPFSNPSQTWLMANGHPPGHELLNQIGMAGAMFDIRPEDAMKFLPEMERAKAPAPVINIITGGADDAARAVRMAEDAHIGSAADDIARAVAAALRAR